MRIHTKTAHQPTLPPPGIQAYVNSNNARKLFNRLSSLQLSFPAGLGRWVGGGGGGVRFQIFLDKCINIHRFDEQRRESYWKRQFCANHRKFSAGTEVHILSLFAKELLCALLLWPSVNCRTGMSELNCHLRHISDIPFFHLARKLLHSNMSIGSQDLHFLHQLLACSQFSQFNICYCGIYFNHGRMWAIYKLRYFHNTATLIPKASHY